MSANYLNNRRYRLNHKVRKEGYRIASRLRTIYVPYFQQNYSKAIFCLRDEYGYSIQLEIPIN